MQLFACHLAIFETVHFLHQLFSVDLTVVSGSKHLIPAAGIHYTAAGIHYTAAGIHYTLDTCSMCS